MAVAIIFALLLCGFERFELGVFSQRFVSLFLIWKFWNKISNLTLSFAQFCALKHLLNPPMNMDKVGPYTSYEWSYSTYKWPYKWVTWVITLLVGVIIHFFTTGSLAANGMKLVSSSLLLLDLRLSFVFVKRIPCKSLLKSHHLGARICSLRIYSTKKITIITSNITIYSLL